MNNSKTVLRYLLKLLIPYKRQIITIILLLILSSVCNLFLPLLSRSIMDDGFIGENQSLLVKLIICTCSLVIFIVMLDLVKERIRIKIQADLKFSLTKQSFSHLHNIGIQYFDDKNHTQILSIIGTDIGSICSIADQSLFFVFTQIFTIIGGIIGLCILNFKLAILVVAFIPVKYVITLYFSKKRYSIMKQYILDCEDYAKWFGDTFSGLKEVKLFNLLDSKTKEFANKQTTVLNQNKNLAFMDSYSTSMDRVILQLLISSIYIIGAIQVFQIQTSIGSVFAFITYSTLVTAPITAIINIKQMLSSVIPSAERFIQFMDLAEEDDGNIQSISDLDISFDNVSFNYSTENKVLENVSFEIPKNSKVALIGNNGSGKSSILNILLRLYDTKEGSITIGKINIKNIQLAKYRTLFSVVSQDVYLFNDTIKNNLCLYKDLSDEQIENVIEICGLTEMIQEKTLDYLVGDNGSQLSIGQKQKLSLARALLHNAPIIILDEATSSADSYSETYINSFFHSHLKNKTVISVTHSNKDLDKFDIIIILKEGQVVGCGSYAELIKHNSYFQDVATCQQTTI